MARRDSEYPQIIQYRNFHNCVYIRVSLTRYGSARVCSVTCLITAPPRVLGICLGVLPLSRFMIIARSLEVRRCQGAVRCPAGTEGATLDFKRLKNYWNHARVPARQVLSGFSLVVSLPMFQCRLALCSDLITFSELGSHENPDVVCFSLFSLSMNVSGFVSKAQCRHVRCPQRRSARREGVRGKVRPGNRSTEAPCPPDSAFLVFCCFFLPVSLPRA